MRTYEVELKRTSYIIVTVVADNEDDAEEKAWHEVDVAACLGDEIEIPEELK
jgi:hypothetical protein